MSIFLVKSFAYIKIDENKFCIFSGTCVCAEKYVGRTCGQCKDGFGNVRAGCRYEKNQQYKFFFANSNLVYS